MGKILLITTKLFGYEKLIIEELKRNGYEVDFFDYALDKRARDKINPFLKILNNIYYRRLKNINLKDKYEEKHRNKRIKLLNKKYDIIIKIGNFYLDESTLILLKNIGSYRILHHWDTIESEEKFLNEKKYFNKISSFDKEDCYKYHLKYLANFYYYTDKPNKNYLYDLYCIMGDESKQFVLENISKICYSKNIKSSLNLLAKHKQSKDINILAKGKNYSEVIKDYKNSKVTLELISKRNNAPTFRSIEVIGLKKKLITNNKNIVNEDFYNSNNILVIDENDIDIPRHFFESSYEELPKEIYEKYSLKKWIKELLS